MEHKGTRELETKRLKLRRFTLDDAREMFDNWANDEEVTKFLTWEAHKDIAVTEEILKEWIAAYQNEDVYNWAISLYDGELLGSISVVESKEKAELAHIGYCISRKWWNRGITSEALQAVIDYLFDEVGYSCIQSRHDPNNPNSGKVMKKCGMRFDGTLRHCDWNNQGICDASYYSLLKEERG